MAVQRIRKPVGVSTAPARAIASPTAPAPLAVEGEALPRTASSGFSYLGVPVHSPGADPSPRGLPGSLRSGIEGATGLSMEAVKVHYDSPRPARLRALAYTAGNDIFLGPSQERHLPHEAWHAVQQRQGRVRPTARITGGVLNDDPRLEREATEMGGRAARGVAPTLPPALPQLGTRGANPVPVIQRMPANQAYHDAITELGAWDIGGNYLDQVGQNTDNNTRTAYIVNAILSYQEVGDIPAVLDAMKAGLSRNRFGNRFAVVLGINAPEGQDAALDAAIEQASAAIAGLRFPVAIVRSTWSGRKFPFGQMRNEVMHSPETRDLTRLFARNGFHPYVSIQDFDTSSRRLPLDGNPHIFEAIDQRLNGGPRPLMISGGYRPGPDLVARTIERFQDDDEVPEALTQDGGEAFLQEFSEHITHDMAVRQVYADQFPLLPYSPEPNLFLDALAVAYGNQLGLGPLNFGEGAAEFTQLAKNLGQYERAELAHHYSGLHASAPPSLDVRIIPEQELPRNQLQNVSSGVSAMAEEPSLLPDDQEEIASRLSIDAQTGRHPRRDLTYLVDFTGLAVETDLSRLAKSYLTKGKDPQSHIGLTMVADRFFQNKGAKEKTSMAKVLGLFKSGRHKDEDEDDEKGEGPFKKWRSVRSDLLDPEGSFSGKPYMPFRQYNEPSSALSTPFDGPFSGVSTGFQPAQKQIAFSSVAMAVPQAVMRLALLLAQTLARAANGTPMDGNCLYHAVIQAQNGGHVDYAAATALRQQAVQWVLNDAHLPTVSQYAFEHGVQIDNLVDTLSRNGNWSGAPGDLVPRIVASALGRTIQINASDGQVHLMQPLIGDAAGTVVIQLDLDHQHYSVPAPPALTSSSQSMNVEME